MKITSDTLTELVIMEVSKADLAALRTLVSTAVWIRSEQLAHEGEFIQISCQDIVVPYLREEMLAGTRLYKELMKMNLPQVPWRKEL